MCVCVFVCVLCVCMFVYLRMCVCVCLYTDSTCTVSVRTNISYARYKYSLTHSVRGIGMSTHTVHGIIATICKAVTTLLMYYRTQNHQGGIRLHMRRIHQIVETQFFNQHKMG